jgi:hypothetical protein
MPAVTLERVLTEAESLPPEERQLLEELLRRQRIERWRQDTAVDARQARQAWQNGELQAEPVERVIERLRAGLAESDER